MTLPSVSLLVAAIIGMGDYSSNRRYVIIREGAGDCLRRCKVDFLAFLNRYLFVLWLTITVVTIIYYLIVEVRLFWARLKIPLDRPASQPLPVPGRRMDYLNFAFVAGFVGVASLWFGIADLVGAELGVGWLIPALLLGKMLRWKMKMDLRMHIFVGEA